VIAAITAGLGIISAPRVEPVAAVAVPVARRPRPVKAAVVEAAVKPPRRQAPPRALRVVAPVDLPEPEPEAEIAAPQSKLLRRSQVSTPDAVPQNSILSVPKSSTTVRGVVKWFDSKAGKGALRLTGISGDVMLEPAALQRASIRRLYKDQEIEATILQTGDRVQLVELSLPGRSAASPNPFGSAGAVTGMVRRQPRQVMVEVKSDGVRQRLARAEAEQVLGTAGTVRLPRRFPT
jgi:cold shock CspA family protein